MAKKLDVSDFFKSLEEEKAAREAREAKAKIDWRKKLKLMPWQRLRDVDLPDEYFESQLIKIEEINSLLNSYIKQICDLIAMSDDYEAYSKEWCLAMRYIFITYILPDGRSSPLLPAVVSSMIDIAVKDAREKRTKSMKEWSATMEIITQELLPENVNGMVKVRTDKISFSPSIEVHGDYVVNKNVENEVSNVEGGATGIDVNKDKK